MGAPRLLLYSTEHCTLCEQALDLLLSMPELAGLPLCVVDIVHDAALVACYGERLPVLLLEGSGDAPVLCWPFDQKAVAGWLRKVS